MIPPTLTQPWYTAVVLREAQRLIKRQHAELLELINTLTTLEQATVVACEVVHDLSMVRHTLQSRLHELNEAQSSTRGLYTKIGAAYRRPKREKK